MRHFMKSATIVGCLLAPWSAFGQADPPDQDDKVLTPARVNEAINRGVKYLSQKQRRQGNWEEMQPFPGGNTALATLALLSCDVPHDDPRIRDALGYLRAIPAEDTYVVALQTMCFQLADPIKDKGLIKRNGEWLMRTRIGNGKWSYGRNRLFNGDTSNTQYALLGLNAAADAGVQVSKEFWDQCRAFWIDSQSGAGTWGYPDQGATGSMTVGGISSLVITSRHIHRVRAGLTDGVRVRCKGPDEDRALRKAIEWIGRNFSVRRNPNGEQGRLYYYLYGLERAGRLTGQRFFGQHDWYRSGARFLIEQQQPDGSWSGAGRAWVDSALWDTSFALLFLSKGRIPILVNKLQYGPERGLDWNNSPNDIHNLTSLMARIWSKPLNWQIVDVKVATVKDLLQAPILQFSGHEPPEFSAREVRLLREFIEQGGYLVADANCSVKSFDRGFRELCKKIFPEPELELKPLEPDHAVWSSLFKLQPNWPLHGINVGCRTAVFYCPEDLSCQWEFPAELNSQAAFNLGANIVAYCTGPEQLLDKLDERTIFEKEPEDKVERNYLRIAKIKHNGDWNLAPRAVRNLLSSLHEKAKVDVNRQQRDMSLLDPNLANYPLIYLHGRTRFILSDKERDLLGKHLSNGGVLLADACCGSESFDEAFRSLMTKLFPDKPLTKIPLDHELYTPQIGHDIRQVKYSPSLGNREGPPILEGIEIDGRYAVVYSKYDLGCAMERQASRDCKGYTHEWAIKIATNVVLYALKE